MTEIEPGPELDYAVAEAIGLMHQWGTRNKMEAWFNGKEVWSWMVSPFSTDLNAAFKAAEKVVGEDGRWSIQRAKTEWIADLYLPDPESVVLGKRICAKYGTPALAICAMILKLSEEKEAS